MTRRSLLFLLICSALFNLFFVAGAFMGWDDAPASAERPRHWRLASIATMLDLSPEQRAAFEILQTEHEEEAELFGDRIRDIRNMISAELTTEVPDLGTVDELAQEETRLRSERRHAGSLRFEEFLELLDPTQRRILGSRIRSRGDGPPQEHLDRMLDDFDLDRNGVLDRTERENAELHHEQRKRDRREQREELRRRFDADKDGTLSPDEQRSLHEFMKKQRGQRPRPRGRGGFPPPPGSPRTP
ncbi:MAG: periplasmic heavy metal sensor [Planctomycetota bacterium]|nr:periplasmic heavy metal sensor [Planctomycetota bacterium]